MVVGIALRALALLVLSLAIGTALAQTTPRETMVSRLIVKFRATGPRAALALPNRVAQVAADTGVRMSHRRSMALGAHVLDLEHPLSTTEAAALVARLARHADIEFVQADQRRRAQLLPNDTEVAFQTYLQNSAPGIDAFAAWDATTGSPNTIVAVVDSGYRPHADLAGRILSGYDFISDAKTANDGDGRDPDASDPGDWINAADTSDPDFAGCDVEISSWHGTAVSGLIAANSNNAQWIAGIDWAAKILPVRVLGKCGGVDSDILDGIAWAAGLPVPGVPANPFPAQIINLSLGGPGECPPAYASVFAQALAHGVTRAIVVAAGNDGGDVANDAPANCPQTIAVAATNLDGALASYSNSGAGITLSAPGGEDTKVASHAILVLSNTGTTVPSADSLAFAAGTSLAAPMVTGVVSLMLSVAPNLTAAQVRSLLTASAKPFPAASTCNASICGAGIVDANAAVHAATIGTVTFNVQGLWWATGGTEAFWGINFAHSGDQVFGTWYTYDTTGKAYWLSMLAGRTTPNSNVYTGDINVDVGPPFNNFVGSGMPTKVGTGTLTFSDANNGTFHYDLNAGTGGSPAPVSQTKAIERYNLGTGAQPTCTYSAAANLALATNYQDLWWVANGAEDGWGVNFAHQGDSVFLTWYTYDIGGAPLWLSALTQRQGATNVYTGTLLRTSGPRFDNYKASDVVMPIPAVGTATLTFSNGNSATFNYTTNGNGGLPAGVDQTKSIVRFPITAGGTRCQ